MSTPNKDVAAAVTGGGKKRSRSKQKNMRKDTRPDNLKPSYRVALPKSGENREDPWSLGVGKSVEQPAKTEQKQPEPSKLEIKPAAHSSNEQKALIQKGTNNTTPKKSGAKKRRANSEKATHESKEQAKPVTETTGASPANVQPVQSVQPVQLGQPVQSIQPVQSVQPAEKGTDGAPKTTPSRKRRRKNSEKAPSTIPESKKAGLTAQVINTTPATISTSSATVSQKGGSRRGSSRRASRKKGKSTTQPTSTLADDTLTSSSKPIDPKKVAAGSQKSPRKRSTGKPRSKSIKLESTPKSDGAKLPNTPKNGISQPKTPGRDHAASHPKTPKNEGAALQPKTPAITDSVSQTKTPKSSDSLSSTIGEDRMKILMEYGNSFLTNTHAGEVVADVE